MPPNWRTTLGGAIGTLGTALMGVGMLPMLAGGAPNRVLWWTAFVGFLLNCAGGFVGHLYATDASAVIELMKKCGIDTSFWTNKK
jgi:hypothetical protein